VSLPYFPMYVDDFEADTAHLTIEEDGAYNRLLRLCWRTHGCSVPDDPKWIMRKMRVSADDYYRVVEPLIDEYFTRGMGRVFSARLQREYEKVSAYHKQKSDAGKASAKSKALKRKKTGRNGVDVSLQQPKPEPKPEPKGVNPLTPLDVLCEVLRPDTAKDFIAHRKALKKPVSAVAAKRIVAKLSDCDNPDAVVDESIANGWQGVFPERKRTNGKQDGSASDMARRIGERFAARAMDRGPRHDASQPLLPTGQSDRGSGGGD